MNEVINLIINKHFRENPKSIDRMTVGLCNEVYSASLSDREAIVRLSLIDDYIRGSQENIPLLKKLGIKVPEMLFEDYSKSLVPYSYQIQNKLKGKDINLVIEDLSDEELKNIAKEISDIFDKTKTIHNNGKYGVFRGDFTDFSDSWTERMRIWIDEIIERGTSTGILTEDLELILENLYRDYKTYFNRVKSTTYLSDISSKNVMIDNGKFVGVVDLDGLTQGDPLETIGRIKASWPSTHHGELYTNAIMDEQKLNAKQREMVLVYAIMNRIAWACENGIKFNENTTGIVDTEKALKDREIINILLEEYNGIK